MHDSVYVFRNDCFCDDMSDVMRWTYALYVQLNRDAVIVQLGLETELEFV